MDVFTGALFLLFLYHQDRLQQKDRHERYFLCLVLLPFLGLFSYTAFLFAVLPLYNLILSTRQDIYYLKFAGIYGLSLGFVILLSYFFDMRLRPIDIVTEGFNDYFISFQSVGEFLKTFGEGTMNLFSRWFAEQPRIIKKVAIFFVPFGFVNMFYGFFKNIRNEKYFFHSLNTITLILFIELFILGALKKYPFTVPRTSLFFCPIVLYMTVQGIVNIKFINKYLYRIVHGLYVAFLSLMTIGLSHLVIIKGDLGAMPKLW